MSLQDRILSHAATLPEGTILTARGLPAFGGSRTVALALATLVRKGALLRAARGCYVVPVESRFGRRAPSPHAVAAAFSQLTGRPVASFGGAAANALGLSTQVPAKAIYVTDGPARTFRLGKLSLEIRKAPAWQLFFPDRGAGLALRALASFRWSAADAARDVRRILPAAEWALLLSARPALPGWLARALTEADRG